MQAVDRLEIALFEQRGHLFPWVPVAMCLGIGWYFALLREPRPWIYGGIGGFVLIGAVWAIRMRSGFAPLVWAPVLIAFGFGLAGVRAHLVVAPVLDWRQYGPVEGRVIGIDRNANGADRVLLDQLRIDDLPVEKTPARVRVSLLGEGGATPVAGARMMMTATMSPPGGPVEPDGFDFRRHAWFQGLGAVGYARAPALLAAGPDGSARLLRIRRAIGARVRAGLSPETAGFGAAIMTGDRAGLSREVTTRLRHANLSHLLAISGLHMGLLTGVSFGLFRFLFALIPLVALRLPAKKIAAFLALMVAAGYYALSGGNVATERAFVMVSVAMVAVMADRRVFSLRAVAVAAVIVLLLRPEALTGPGFQMSFAATTALVFIFGLLRDRPVLMGPAWARPVTATVISSLVAGLATAPVAAAHFNMLAHFGLLANLMSVPVMGIVVIPAAVAAVVLMPIGLESLGLWVMDLGLGWILFSARWVSGMEGAVSGIPAPGPWVLPLIGIGGAVVVIWHGRLRHVGWAPICAAAMLWALAERPAILIDGEGRIVGVLTDQGRALSRERSASFPARIWLENDGELLTTQARAAARWPKGGRFSKGRITHITRKKTLARFRCRPGDILVTPHKAPKGLPCRVIDRDLLRRTGSIAITHAGMRSARVVAGKRLWSGGARDRARGQ